MEPREVWEVERDLTAARASREAFQKQAEALREENKTLKCQLKIYEEAIRALKAAFDMLCPERLASRLTVEDSMIEELAPTDALEILDAWQRMEPSRSIETVNNATDGSISAWAVTLEYERGAPPSKATRYRVVQEARQPTLTEALVALASLLT